MTGSQIDEVPSPGQIAPARELTALVGRARRGPRDSPVEVAQLADFDAAFGAGETPLRRAVGGYLDQGAPPLLVVRTTDLTRALEALAPTPATLLVVAPALLRGHEAEVHTWCEELGRFLLLDCPDGLVPAGLGAHAAGYAPRLRNAAGQRVWTAAAVAGVVRRLDGTRGVWRAPAGLEAEVHGVSADPAPVAAAANLIRGLPDGNLVVWGAHTASADPEWRYVNVRRYLSFLERSIDAGTAWAVFEPNDEPLWAALRASIGDFLEAAWRSGALQGQTPDEAFFVRCDRTTMTQADLDAGHLVCFVGVAPIRPAEFVIIRIARVVGAGLPD